MSDTLDVVLSLLERIATSNFLLFLGTEDVTGLLGSWHLLTLGSSSLQAQSSPGCVVRWLHSHHRPTLLTPFSVLLASLFLLVLVHQSQISVSKL